MDALKISTAIQINKPQNEIFDAIVGPEKMSGYFISESTGTMEEGRILQWKFPEFAEEVPVTVVEVTKNEYVSFTWEGAKAEKLLVEITLVEVPESSTLVKITEGEMRNNKKGVKWLAQNTEGWANFLACLKAYLEHGINLRKGAFDFMKETT